MNRNNSQVQPLDKTAVKCKFFGQYLEQIIAKETKYPNSPTINTTSVLLIDELSNYHLELKPLSKITDEDAIVVAKIFGMTEDFEFIGKMLCTTMFDNSDSESETSIFNSNAKAVDYLRSKGYALPFRIYSVEDLVSFGWVQLI